MSKAIAIVKEESSLTQIISDIESQLNINDFNVLFVIEEVVTNIFEHSKKIVDNRNICVSIEFEKSVLSIKIENVKDYDFIRLTNESKLKSINYNLDNIGGLGLGLIDNIVEEKTYFHDGKSQYYKFIFKVVL